MKVLVVGGSTPYGYGIGQDDDTLWMISPCCDQKLEYMSVESPTKGMTDGKPSGPAVLRCTSCNNRFRGYSNDSYPTNESAYGWIQTWTGLSEVKVEVEY